MKNPGLMLDDDDELLGRWRTGDGGAGTELCRRHHDDARGYARSLGRGVADPDDIVSEAFSKVLHAMRRGQGPRNGFRKYLFTAVRTCAFDEYRRHTPTTHEVPDRHEEQGYDGIGDTESPMLVALAGLPERARQVLWLLEVEGWSVTEVAKMLGTTPGAVSALAYRSRGQLRQRYVAHLAEADGSPDCAPVESATAEVGSGLLGLTGPVEDTDAADVAARPDAVIDLTASALAPAV